MRNPTFIGTLYATTGALFLSFDTLLLRLADGEPMQMVFWRSIFMFSAGFMVFLLLSATQLNKVIGFFNGRVGLLVAFFYGAANICFVASAMMTSIANMLVIVATAPLWAALMSRLFLKESISFTTLLTSLVALSGIVIVSWPGFEMGFRIGDLVALCAAFSMAAAFVSSRFSPSNLALAPALGGAFSAPIGFIFAGHISFSSSTSFVTMLIEGAVLVPIALGLIAISPKYLPAPHVGLFLLLETVLGPLWIWLFMNEAPSIYAIIGGSIVVSALIFHVWAASSLPKHATG